MEVSEELLIKLYKTASNENKLKIRTDYPDLIKPETKLKEAVTNFLVDTVNEPNPFGVHLVNNGINDLVGKSIFFNESTCLIILRATHRDIFLPVTEVIAVETMYGLPVIGYIQNCVFVPNESL